MLQKRLIELVLAVANIRIITTIAGAVDLTGPQGVKSDTGLPGLQELKGDPGSVGPQVPEGSGAPSGYPILGETSTPPGGYTYTGDYVLSNSIESWTAKANMPTALDGLAAATVNGKVYAIGGYAGGYLGMNEELDI